MSPRKLLVLTAVVLLLFGFILLFERKLPSTSQKQEKGDVVWEIPQDRIEMLRLEHGGLTVELKQTAEGAGRIWKMTKPEAYPADASVAGDMASQLARLRRADNEIAEAPSEAYGFRSPSGKVTVVLPTTVWNVVEKVPRFRCKLTRNCVLAWPGASLAHSSTR